MKNTKVELKDIELKTVSDGVMPILLAKPSTISTVVPLAVNPESKGINEQRNALVPIPY